MPTSRPHTEEYDLIPLLATAKKLVDESSFVSKRDASKFGCKSTAERVQEIYRNTVNNLSYIDIMGCIQGFFMRQLACWIKHP